MTEHTGNLERFEPNAPREVEQIETIEQLADEYRAAGDDRRVEMYLFYRELRALFELIELEE